ncbi:MAG: hypothetical protein QXS63_01135 [Zestosphaera sp.]
MIDFEKFIKRFRRKVFSRHHNFYLDCFNGDFSGYAYRYNIFRGYKISANSGIGLTSLIEKVISIPSAKEIFIYAYSSIMSSKELDRFYSFKPVKLSYMITHNKIDNTFSANLNSYNSCNLSQNRVIFPFSSSLLSSKSCGIINNVKTLASGGQISCQKLIDILPLT